MIYSSFNFIAFFGVVLAAYLVARGRNSRLVIALGSSLVFYAWNGWVDTLIFASVVLVSWLALYGAQLFPRYRRSLIALGISLMVLHLFFWKYASWLLVQVGGQPLNLPLPVGISFFTLQGIAYLVDYIRREAPFMPLKEYALFKSFFPQLIAGPIIRANEFLPQIRNLPRPQLSDITAGLSLFLMGLFKKIVLADRVAAFCDNTFQSFESFKRASLILGVLAYTVQIWADFSGYTDMGRGAARMLGIHLPENFKSPYLSATPSEFWKRWHITLSEWIRDYIYKPLSSAIGRQNSPRIALALFLTMATSGLWHGANWTFLVWGLYHGALLAAERFLRASRIGNRFGLLSVPVRRALLWPVMFSATAFGWLIFRAPDLKFVGNYLSAILKGSGQLYPASFNGIYASLFFCFAFQLATYFPLPIREWTERSLALRPRLAGVLSGMSLAVLFIGAIFFRWEDIARPFIYFQF